MALHQLILRALPMLANPAVPSVPLHLPTAATFPLPPPALLELCPHPPLPALPIPNRYVVMVAMIASAGGLLFGECLRVGCLPAHYTRLVGPACVCTLHCM